MSTHRLSGTPIYSIWSNMKATCKKCNLLLEEKWEEFEAFYEWAIHNGYKESLYLSRLDKKTGYIPSNLIFIEKEVKKEHGLYNTRIYRIWVGIKARCHNPNDTAFDKYGAKGIRVCTEWFNSFEPFYKWSINNGYDDTLTLDRMDPKGDYEPDNCRWVTFDVQANNKSTNVYIEIDDQKKTLTQWAEIYGISPITVRGRYQKGIRGMDLFKEPMLTGAGTPVFIEINGETKRPSEWAEISGVNAKTIISRYNSGVRGDDLLTQRLGRSFEYIVEIDGVSKPLKQWAEEADCSYDTLLERYKKGIPGKELLKVREKPILEIEINGVIKTLDEWSKETGINKNTISSRYYSGKRGEALIRKVTRKPIIVEYQEKSQSLNAWGNELNIDPETLRRRYHQGLRGEQLFKITKNR